MTRSLLTRIGLTILAVIVALKTILGIIGDSEVIANFGTPGTLPNNLMKWFVGLPAWGFFIAGAAFVVLAFWDRLFAKAEAAVEAPSQAPVLEQKIVRRIVGEVLDDNFYAFCARLEKAVGTVVGVQVGISIPIEPRMAQLGDDNAVYLFNGVDLDVNVRTGAGWSHGEIVFDGFWMVKYGGMGQGIRSIYLNHVADAGILLNPAITIEDEHV